MNKLLIVILCIVLSGCSLEPSHKHTYGIITCGDGITRIQCVNYPCSEGCLLAPLDKNLELHNISIVERPREYWEVNTRQAEELCRHPEDYFVWSDETEYWDSEKLHYASVRVKRAKYDALKKQLLKEAPTSLNIRTKERR